MHTEDLRGFNRAITGNWTWVQRIRYARHNTRHADERQCFYRSYVYNIFYKACV